MLKKSWLDKILVLPYFLIIVGITLLIIKLTLILKNKVQYDSGVGNNIGRYDSHNIVEKENEEQIDNYIGYIKIPKINLEQGLVDKNSHLNYVDFNIQIIQESNMPDIEGGNLILAAHSGNSPVSYFKDLNKLVQGDFVHVVYNNKLYTYKVSNYYAVEKTGMVDIVRNSFITTLSLITCIENTNKQLVIICELIKINNL